MARQTSGRKFVVYAALAGNLLIAVTKFAAAAITGSSSMLTEGIHSLVDTVNQALLLHGIRRSRRSADALHPFGYGREVYFWSFVVALLIFSGGAAASIYEGIVHIRAAESMARPEINFIVLALAFLFEGTSWTFAIREFSASRGKQGWWRALRDSKDPSTLVVLCEDSAALVGIIIAAVFIAASLLTETPVLDGVGSILIGVVLGIVALLLAIETKGLLIGERAAPAIADTIREIVGKRSDCRELGEVRTSQLGPDEILAILTVDFRPDLRAAEMARQMQDIEAAIRRRHGAVKGVYIKPYVRDPAPAPEK